MVPTSDCCPIPGTGTRAEATTEDLIAAGRDCIVHVHFNDSPDLPPEQIHDNQRLLPGQGVINLTAVLQVLQSIRCNNALSVEVFGPTKDMTPEAAAKAGLDSSLAVFCKAGVPRRMKGLTTKAESSSSASILPVIEYRTAL